jgi:hypothetical protein
MLLEEVLRYSTYVMHESGCTAPPTLELLLIYHILFIRAAKDSRTFGLGKEQEVSLSGLGIRQR